MKKTNKTVHDNNNQVIIIDRLVDHHIKTSDLQKKEINNYKKKKLRTTKIDK